MFDKIPIECPGCNGAFDIGLSDARNNKTVTCPHCSEPIDIKGSDAAKDIDQINDAIKDAGFQ